MDVVTLALAKKSAKQYTDDAIEGLGKGIIYKGAVNYYNDLPNNAEIGDCYSILYRGTTGTEPSGVEYVWGKVSGSSAASWIQLGADIESGVVTSFWNGSQAEYDLIDPKNPTTLYLINESE